MCYQICTYFDKRCIYYCWSRSHPKFYRLYFIGHDEKLIVRFPDKVHVTLWQCLYIHLYPKYFCTLFTPPPQNISNVLKWDQIWQFQHKWKVFVCFSCILPSPPKKKFSFPHYATPKVDAGAATSSGSLNLQQPWQEPCN